MPDAVDFDAAAGFGVAYTTAYHALSTAGGIRFGDWIVVIGAAGGVGLATVDLARHLGARVVAAASGHEKTALCLDRGATAAVDYRNEDLRRRIKEITGEGAHVVVDPVAAQRRNPLCGPCAAEEPSSPSATHPERYRRSHSILSYSRGSRSQAWTSERCPSIIPKSKARPGRTTPTVRDRCTDADMCTRCTHWPRPRQHFAT